MVETIEDKNGYLLFNFQLLRNIVIVVVLLVWLYSDQVVYGDLEVSI